MTTEEKQTLFKLRTRMVDVKCNFKNMYEPNLICPFCPEEDTQAHLLSCGQVIVGLDTSGSQYEDIFKDVSKQENIAKVYNKILRQRNLKLKILAK